jgi:endonuclease/exonuclease/phosphatase family metal-dependent hydrolase
VTVPLNPPPTPAAGTRRRLLAVACYGYLAAVVGLCVLLRWADQWWPATLLLFSPRLAFALPLPLLAPVALLFRRPALLLPLALAGLLVAGPLAGGVVPWRQLAAAPPDEPPFRVLTCNMHYGRFGPAALEHLVAQTDPDVVALQEWPRQSDSALLTGPGWHAHRTHGLFLASRHPILRADILGNDSNSKDGRVGRYELDTPGGVVVVFSLHLASPREGVYATIHQTEGGAAPVEDNADLRWRQSRSVAEAARKERTPVVLLGDFNTPAESSIFRTVWGDYTDAFAAAGWGWGYTFHGGRTWVRIDHVLAGPGWRCTRCWVAGGIGSPHFPVLADLVREAPGPR